MTGFCYQCYKLRVGENVRAFRTKEDRIILVADCGYCGEPMARVKK